jgi:cell wall-associated NlpC family hydrolase
MRVPRSAALSILTLSLCVAAWPGGAAARPPVSASAASPASRWIAVSVATLWVGPGLARPVVDDPAVAAPSDPRGWVAGMSVAQKRWLVGKLETQALYGDRVIRLATSGAWSRVVVPGQPTPRDPRGYPGWMPTRQLTAMKPAAGLLLAVITQPTAWAWKTPALTGRALELSYGTRLPALGWTPASVEVALLDGRHLYLKRAAVTLRRRGAVWPRPNGARLVAEARRFLGLQYLWAGTSGFGVDCSGFTCLVYGALGVTIPRDAGPQAATGVKVALGALRAGDLVFFRAASGSIHHVGMYVGGGRMIHAPATGLPVGIVSLSAEPYAREFAGARRYVP